MTFTRTFKKGDRVKLVDDPAAVGFFVRGGLDGLTVVVEWDDTSRPATTAKDRLRHAPVTVIGREVTSSVCCSHSYCTTYTTHGSGLCDGHRTCPECGKPISVDPDAIKGSWVNGKLREVTVRVEHCGFCDYIKEVVK